ncbi:U11/U12 small nuclear ribonucleoprotein 65 kDa protein [Taenia crassiceps]|uniref:U11/U12 small nuclear ribonucleoprotein 65 kDa protein n=1 Tax=Taenia crassiceps TaxID=6207 RepID=A0ABR4QQH4_9CEST
MLAKEAFDGLRVLHFKNFAYELRSNDIECLLRRLGATDCQIYLSCNPATNHRALAEFKSSDDCWRLIKSLHQREVFEGYWRSISQRAFLARATPTILTNIVRCLASVSAFYVQTLHLMNRLNLPAPFCNTSEFPGALYVVTEEDLLHRVTSPSTSQINSVPEEMDVSSGPESEINNDSDDDPGNGDREKLAPLTFLPRKAPSKLKAGLLSRQERRLDLRGKALRPSPCMAVGGDEGEEKTVQPSSVLSTQPAEPVFEECILRSAPHIEMRLIGAVKSSTNELNENEAVGGFGAFSASESVTAELHSQSNTEAAFPPHHPSPPPGEEGKEDVAVEEEEKEEEDEYFARPAPLSPGELYAGKAPHMELVNNPIFSKSTGPGVPSSRLYIKNLHKRTNEEDLWRVFGSFRQEATRRKGLPSQFSIQLLTGGRMRGQAFVGFDSIELATEALSATHGFLLNGKPMHVQFARGVIAKPDPNSLIT